MYCPLVLDTSDLLHSSVLMCSNKSLHDESHSGAVLKHTNAIMNFFLSKQTVMRTDTQRTYRKCITL